MKSAPARSSDLARYGSGPVVAHVVVGDMDGLMMALDPMVGGQVELMRIQPTPPPPDPL